MKATISDKKSVQILIDVCRAQGLKHVVISPGSRNAPLIISFASCDGFVCYPIVDERSAGYFALGLAQQLREPVALVCTSGTAVLNYASAVAEAFYQQLPLVVITADRPREWVGQADGQTINQTEVFKNYIKYSCDLPVEIYHTDDQWCAKRLVSEAFLAAKSNLPGPVHINIPLREPLYGRAEYSIKVNPSIVRYTGNGRIGNEQLDMLLEVLATLPRIMLIVGMRETNNALTNILSLLGAKPNVVVLTETLSNCYGDGFVRCIDRVVGSFSDQEMASFAPDLLISFDGPVLSKMVKQFIKENSSKEHWHISAGGQVIDTYRSLTRVIEGDAVEVLTQLFEKWPDQANCFNKQWMNRACQLEEIHHNFIKALPWCDLAVYNTIFESMPRPIQLQLGNSTPVRYTQLFDCFEEVTQYANRGTSGIDGSVSTAIGAAWATQQPTLLIVGDLSFFYDSNAFWNQFVSPNLKVILINNGGGDIFRFLPGSSSSQELDNYFAMNHSYDASWVANRFGIGYSSVSSLSELELALPKFFNSDGTQLLEIFTPKEINSQQLKNYFSMLKVNSDSL